MSDADKFRIQRFADKYGVEIHVVGSQADGSASADSDYDYIIGEFGGSSRLRQKARRELPRGSGGGEIRPSGIESGVDVFKEPLDRNRPFVTFAPQAKESEP